MRSPRPNEPVPVSGRQVELAVGDLRATVVEVGGGVRAFTNGARPVLDGYGLDETATFAQGQALMPWPNRLADGRYEFAMHNAIHGLARWANWQLGEHESSRAVLSVLLHPQAGYPFALALQTEYTLDTEGLAVRTVARNVGRDAAPYGAGFHPYLTVGTDKVDSARLQVPAATRLELDERGIPTGQRLALDDGKEDFRMPRAIGPTNLDTPSATSCETPTAAPASAWNTPTAGWRSRTGWMRHSCRPARSAPAGRRSPPQADGRAWRHRGR